MQSKSKLKEFFSGQLSDEAEQQIMDQVYNDEFKQLLKQELAHHNAGVVTHALQDDDEETAETAAATIVSMPTSKPRVWYLSRKPLGIAASALLLIVMVRVLFQNNLSEPSKADAIALMQGFLQDLPPKTVTAGGGEPTPSEMRLKANQYYADGKHQEAAIGFQQLVDRGSSTMDDFFYGGLSFISDKNPTPNYGKAVNYLLKVRNNSHGRNSDAIHLYLAIAYFKNKQWKESKALFEQIAQHSGIYQDTAKQVLSTFPNE